VLQNLEVMERVIKSQSIPVTETVPKPPGPVAVPAAALLPAPPDLSRLPRAKVLRIADGDTIVVQKKPGVTPIRLLGVAAPPFDSRSLRVKFLEDLIKDQDVAFVYDPDRPLDKGRIVAQVYRVSDGLFVNLKVVEEGYAATAADAPAPLERTLRAAELQAQKAERGLWSPAAAQREAALSEQKKNDQPALAGRGGRPAPGKTAANQPARGAGDREQAAMQEITDWLQAQKQEVALREIQIVQNSRDAASRRREARRAMYSPEIDPAVATGALALLAGAVLIFTDRRRSGSA
jgi:endonuclease YncB( thermonuclease family)